MISQDLNKQLYRFTVVIPITPLDFFLFPTGIWEKRIKLLLICVELYAAGQNVVLQGFQLPFYFYFFFLDADKYITSFAKDHINL